MFLFRRTTRTERSVSGRSPSTLKLHWFSQAGRRPTTPVTHSPAFSWRAEVRTSYLLQCYKENYQGRRTSQNEPNLVLNLKELNVTLSVYIHAIQKKWPSKWGIRYSVNLWRNLQMSPSCNTIRYTHIIFINKLGLEESTILYWAYVFDRRVGGIPEDNLHYNDLCKDHSLPLCYSTHKQGCNSNHNALRHTLQTKHFFHSPRVYKSCLFTKFNGFVTDTYVSLHLHWSHLDPMNPEKQKQSLSRHTSFPLHPKRPPEHLSLQASP